MQTRITFDGDHKDVVVYIYGSNISITNGDHTIMMSAKEWHSLAAETTFPEDGFKDSDEQVLLKLKPYSGPVQLVSGNRYAYVWPNNTYPWEFRIAKHNPSNNLWCMTDEKGDICHHWAKHEELSEEFNPSNKYYMYAEIEE